MYNRTASVFHLVRSAQSQHIIENGRCIHEDAFVHFELCTIRLSECSRVRTTDSFLIIILAHLKNDTPILKPRFAFHQHVRFSIVDKRKL